MSTDGTFKVDPEAQSKLTSDMATMRISAGRKEKLSKGDIVGFLCKEGGLDASLIGNITLSDHHALVAIPAEISHSLLEKVRNAKIKGSKRKLILL